MIPRANQLADAHIVVDGKFFRLGTKKYYLKGVTYGPFAPNSKSEMLPDPVRAQQDFELIASLMLPDWTRLPSIKKEAGQ